MTLARARVFEPTLVLMDEPLGAFDRQLREHMQLELTALQKRLGVTVVYVTHDQGGCSKLCVTGVSLTG